MKAVILSGGSGQRLAPLTNTTTKQLLPVANKPTLFHILDLIKEETPIKEVCVVVSEEYGHQVKEKLINSEYSNYFQFDFVFQVFVPLPFFYLALLSLDALHCQECLRFQDLKLHWITH